MTNRWLSASLAVLLALAPAVALVPRTVQAAVESQPPRYKSRAEIPAAYKWKLEDLYPDRAAWEADVRKTEALADQFAAHKGFLGKGDDHLRQAFADYEALSRIYEKAYVYAKLSLDVNAGNQDLQSVAGRAERLHAKIAEKTAFFEAELLKLPKRTMEHYLESETLAPYKRYLQNLLKNSTHALSEEQESLLAQMSTITKVPENTYRMLSKDLRLPTVRDEQGRTVQLTRANYGAFLENANREVRKGVYQALTDTYRKYQDTYAQTLAGEVRANNFYAKVRNYPSALEASLHGNEVPTRVYDELLATVRANLPLLHRYVDLKRKWLKLDDLHTYDLYLPLVKGDTRYIPYEEAKKMVLTALKPLGDDYVQALQGAFENGWIDVYATEDKRGGAYQWGAFDGHPYVMLNYRGTLDDVSTLAHELGHAMQSYYTNKTQPYLTAHYPIFTAEVASTMNEHLLFESLYKQATTKQEKIRLLAQWLETFRNTIFRQTQFAEFEKKIHELEANGTTLTAEVLNNTYRELNAAYYGPSLVNDEQNGLEWARIPHLYYGFYVYQYATSFAASAALAEQVQREGATAVQRIKDQFLSAGSSKPPLEVLKAAGVDMSTAQPIQAAMKQFEAHLSELESLMKN